MDVRRISVPDSSNLIRQPRREYTASRNSLDLLLNIWGQRGAPRHAKHAEGR